MDLRGLAAQEPPPPEKGILPNLALVHIDGDTPQLALLLHLLQRLGERPLRRRLGPDEALARPLAPEAQPVQITPSGRRGDGLAQSALDEGRDAPPCPDAGLEPDLARGTLDDGLQLRQLCEG